MQSFKLDPAHLMNEVYSFPFPEVRDLLGGRQLDQCFMLNTIAGEAAAPMLEAFGFEPPLALTTRADGSLDLDELHLPVQERITQQLNKAMPGLADFQHRYPVAGSSPAIFNLLAEWSANGKLSSIAVLDGEYEGYRALAEALAVPIVSYNGLEGASPVAGQVWFVSNPSARDGNWIDDDVWSQFLASGSPVVVDAAYVGLTADDRTLDVSAPNVVAVLTSPSKIFGVFRHRYTGTTYTRVPVASMYGMKWFKDVPALLDTLSLYESFPSGYLAHAYKPWQEAICEHVAQWADAPVTPSDVILLGTTPGAEEPRLAPFVRNGLARFGLTKLFEDWEDALLTDP